MQLFAAERAVTQPCPIKCCRFPRVRTRTSVKLRVTKRCEFLIWQKRGTNNPTCIHSTPCTKHFIRQWQFLDEYVGFLHINSCSSESYVSADVELCFIPKQNECRVYFSTICPWRYHATKSAYSTNFSEPLYHRRLLRYGLCCAAIPDKWKKLLPNSIWKKEKSCKVPPPPEKYYVMINTIYTVHLLGSECRVFPAIPRHLKRMWETHRQKQNAMLRTLFIYSFIIIIIIIIINIIIIIITVSLDKAGWFSLNLLEGRGN